MATDEGDSDCARDECACCLVRAQARAKADQLEQAQRSAALWKRAAKEYRATAMEFIADWNIAVNEHSKLEQQIRELKEANKQIKMERNELRRQLAEARRFSVAWKAAYRWARDPGRYWYKWQRRHKAEVA